MKNYIKYFCTHTAVERETQNMKNNNTKNAKKEKKFVTKTVSQLEINSNTNVVTTLAATKTTTT